MTTRPKKKRFEGLIHFKDSLRQTVVCLQASLSSKFATSVQSEFVRKLDEGSDDAHFLLFSSGTQVGQVDEEHDLCSHHILSRIHQKEAGELADEVCWHRHDKSKVSVWIDPSDHLAASAIYRIISCICYSGQTLNLKDCQNWGSLITSHSYTDLNKAKAWLNQWQGFYQLNIERLNLIRSSLEQLTPDFTAIDQLYLSSDGTSISLIIEGELLDQLKNNLDQTVEKLRGLSYHSVIINMSDKDQLCLTSPIRLLTFHQQSPLRSFVLIRGLEKVSSQGLNKKIAG